MFHLHTNLKIEFTFCYYFDIKAFNIRPPVYILLDMLLTMSRIARKGLFMVKLIGANFRFLLAADFISISNAG